MERAGNIPYAWQQIENEVLSSVLCQLSILEEFGPDDVPVAEVFLGMNPDQLDRDFRRGEEHNGEAERSIKLERFRLYRIVRNAYNYAYQTDGWQKATFHDYHVVCCGLLSGGYPQSDADAEPSPLARWNDQALKRVLETFAARWKLANEHYRGGLTVKELSLLSNMTVAAVRTSLSKEGFKLEATVRGSGNRDENGTLPEEEAIVWLSRRRSFIPNRKDEAASTDVHISVSTMALWLETLPFDQALRTALPAIGSKRADLLREVGSDATWLEGLADGQRVAIDIPRLRKLAKHLGANEAEFAAKAVQHLIALDLNDRQDTDSEAVS